MGLEFEIPPTPSELIMATHHPDTTRGRNNIFENVIRVSNCKRHKSIKLLMLKISGIYIEV